MFLSGCVGRCEKKNLLVRYGETDGCVCERMDIARGSQLLFFFSFFAMRLDN